jgi:two-component system sensor kinase FixL
LNSVPSSLAHLWHRVSGRNWLRALLLHVALFAALLLLLRLSALFQTTELRSTPWHPESGLAVGAGFLMGWSAVPTTALAFLVSTRLWGWPLPGQWDLISAMLRALVFCGAACAAAPMLRRLPIPSLQTVLLFFGFSAVLTAAYALVRLAVLWFSIGLEPAYVLPYTVTLSIGNLLGILTLGPLFMMASPVTELTHYFRRWTGFQAVMLVSLIAVAFIVFGVRGVDEFKFFYLIFLPVIAFAVRDGYVAAAFSVLVSDLLMMAILYGRDFGSSSATELQFLMLSLSMTGLLLGAAISDRAFVVNELENSHLRLQESQAALLQASRLSLASEMAAALAHELNQPLSSIRNFIRSARRRLDADSLDVPALREGMDAAVGQVDSAADLLRSTRKFLERGSVQREPLKLDGLLSRCAELVRPELRRAGITLIIKNMSSLPAVVCNEVQIQQVVLNVIKNAREAIIAGDSASRRIVIEGSAGNRPGFVELAISDTGPGISPDIKPLIFHPLQSSKPEGLGLGLSLCSTIIRSHGGEFWFDQDAASGARFLFTLPISAPNGSIT